MAVTLTQGSSGAWVAPASSTDISPAYPGSLATGDCIYALLHVKPDTATVATPTNWTFVGSESGGSGAVGAGTGPTRMWLFKRLVPGGGLAGTETFTVTSGSSMVGYMRAYRASGGTNMQYQEKFTYWSVTTASTAVGGTAVSGLDLTAGDEISLVIGTTDDTTGTLTLTTITAAGATLGTPARNPGGTITNAQGNDIAATTYTVAVSAGSSTDPPVVAATSNAAETAMGFLWRIRASEVTTLPPTVPRRLPIGALLDF